MNLRILIADLLPDVLLCQNFVCPVTVEESILRLHMLASYALLLDDVDHRVAVQRCSLRLHMFVEYVLLLDQRSSM